MSNLRIGYLNYADLATITASPVATTTGPVTYLQNDARGDIFLASSTAVQEVKGTWNGTAYTISSLSLWRHNLAYNDTINLFLYSDAAWTTVLYASDLLPAYASGLFTNWGWAFTNRYFTPVTEVKSFKLSFAGVASGSSPTSVALQASRLYLGPYTEAPINPAEGFILAPETNARQTRSEGGSLRSGPKADWRSATFDMVVKTEADRAAWYEISRYCGISKSFVASLFPGTGGTAERDHTIFGKFDGKSPAMKLATNRFDFGMKIVEI